MLSPQKLTRRTGAVWGSLALACALAGCSSVPAPTAEMAVARSTLDRVVTQPSVAAAAPVELQQAREKLARAEQALAEKKHLQARRLAQEAQADAQLAESKANAAKNQAALDEVRRANQALSDELLRQPAR
ncbi:DUF4398 domain-containing protein [Comamonadaceae bacterium OH3737_COT-264]|nr:DUF4398 domain-containing protein [Comamonadaceae bacterium OH3737_COT-264]